VCVFHQALDSPLKATSAARVRQALGTMEHLPLVLLSHDGMLPDVNMPTDLEMKRIQNALDRCPLT
jgi:hypothetical protein